MVKFDLVVLTLVQLQTNFHALVVTLTVTFVHEQFWLSLQTVALVVLVPLLVPLVPLVVPLVPLVWLVPLVDPWVVLVAEMQQLHERLVTLTLLTNVVTLTHPQVSFLRVIFLVVILLPLLVQLQFKLDTLLVLLTTVVQLQD